VVGRPSPILARRRRSLPTGRWAAWVDGRLQSAQNRAVARRSFRLMRPPQVFESGSGSANFGAMGNDSERASGIEPLHEAEQRRTRVVMMVRTEGHCESCGTPTGA